MSAAFSRWPPRQGLLLQKLRVAAGMPSAASPVASPAMRR